MEKKMKVEIGRRLRQKRDEKGYSREQLAELIDKSPRFIANYESGDSGMSLDTLKAVCIALGTSADYILLGEHERDYADIVYALEHIDDAHYAYLRAVVKAYTEVYMKEYQQQQPKK